MMVNRLFLLFVACFLASCGNPAKVKEENSDIIGERIIQDQNGTLLLDLEDADYYSDLNNPCENTAEWNAVIVKSGRYDIWLSSATRDTLSLNYKNSVHLNFNEINLAATPKCDRIKSSIGSFFIADSYIGTVYIQDTGAVAVQFVSEQIVPHNIRDEVDSRFVSLYFVPEVKK